MKKLLILALVALLPFSVSAQTRKAKDNKTEQTDSKKDSKSSKDSKSKNSKEADSGSSSGSSNSSSQIVRAVTVDQAKKDVAHFSTIILEGQLTHQIGDRDFVLTDASGSIKIELTDETEYYVDGEILLGSTVRVLGVVKKRLWDDTVIEGVKLKVVTPSAVGGF